MLKMRLKRCGRKSQPTFRIIVIQNTSKRDGRALEEVGLYNTFTKEIRLNIKTITNFLKIGVKPTQMVQNLLFKAKILN
jgi:small subunit ribosomal protein S16